MELMAHSHCTELDWYREHDWHNRKQSSFFQNEGIFAQLDELDELGKSTHAWIRIHL